MTERAKKERTRGIATVDDLRRMSDIDPVTRCWHYRGAKAPNGQPRIWAFDHDKGDMASLSGPRAVWNIAHGCGPGRWLAFRWCFVGDCVCPAHHKLARDVAEICRAAKRAGVKWGPPPEVRRVGLVAARRAAGIAETPADVVLRVRELFATGGRTGKAIAAEMGLSESVVSRIKHGSYAAVVLGPQVYGRPGAGST